MAYLRRILWTLHLLKRMQRRGYTKDVLYAGWVNLPRLPQNLPGKPQI